MKVAVRKLQVEDAAKLQMLVAENIDAIEPGLVVLDSRLLLGHATIDVVGLDTNGALVLIATGLIANEEMLLKAVEAYSWSREYPESLERLYPSCIISDERPPRLVFVVERMPDAFHRKIKQLGFPEVDCVEFRLLDVDGAPALFFESILRLRRPVATPAHAPRVETPPADSTPAGGENVIAMNGAVAARATSLKLQKLLNQAVADAPRAIERPVAPAREPAAVVSMMGRQAAASAPRVERPRPEPVTLREAEPVIAPAPVIAHAPVRAAVEPLIAAAPVMAAEPVIAVEPVVAAAPVVISEPEPVFVPGPIIVTPEPVIATPDPVVVAPAPVIVTPEPIVLPKAVVEPEPDLVAQMQAALAALEHDAVADAVAEPKLELVTEPELAEVEPEPELELAAEPKLELVTNPEPVVAAEPKLELVVEPKVVAEPVIPSLSGTPSNGERISLRSLPELSLQPSAPVTVPRPAPIPAPAPVAKPAVAAEKPAAAATTEPRVSFKDLAAALLGPTSAPAAPALDVKAPVVSEPLVASAPVEDAPVAPAIALTPSALDDVVAQAEAVIIEPVSPEMAEAVADLEPALTVEALINSTLAPAPAAPAAVAAPAAPAAKKPEPEAAKPAAEMPVGFAGLQFPKDGVMTRQWMEFLSQMSNSK